jgi:hypothetical protein
MKRIPCRALERFAIRSNRFRCAGFTLAFGHDAVLRGARKRLSDGRNGLSVAIGAIRHTITVVLQRIVPAGSSPTRYAPVEGRRNRRRFLPISLSFFALFGISGRHDKYRYHDGGGGNRSESFA